MGMPFHALTGAELKAIVLQRVDGLVQELPGLSMTERMSIYTRIVRELDLDERFQYHLTYLSAKWEAQLFVGSPLPVGAWKFVLTVSHGSGGSTPDGFEVLVQSQLPIVPANGLGVPTARAPQAQAPVVVPAAPVPTVSTSGGMSDAEIERAAGPSNRLDPNAQLASGGPIETDLNDMGPDWVPAEDRAAFELEKAAVARHNARLERAMREGGGPTASVSGEIDNPNAARREAGLPVPSPHPVEGAGVVDLEPGQDVF